MSKVERTHLWLSVKSLTGKRRSYAKFPMSPRKPVGWREGEEEGESGKELWVAEVTVHKAVKGRLLSIRGPE